MPPLLSICIPAYNGARYLRVMLEALLPQVRLAGGAAEVVVIDDASTDDTGEVVQAAERHGPVRYVRNATNGGSARNIVKGPVELATGEFVCVWSQHCLIYPGALPKLLQVLEEKRHLDALYINFRCAKYPQDWPNQAEGGYGGAYDYIANLDLQSHDVVRWETLLDTRSAFCTQSYAHIAKRAVWVSYWRYRPIDADFTSVYTTYPHTCTVAENLFGRPTYYVGEPVLTIFNGAQWWSSLKSRTRVYLRGYPELLQLYQRLGWSGQPLREAQALGSGMAESIMKDLFQEWRTEEGRLLLRYLWKYWYHQGTLRSLWHAFIESECCWLSRFLPRCQRALEKAYRYCFHQCRPARWVGKYLKHTA